MSRFLQIAGTAGSPISSNFNLAMDVKAANIQFRSSGGFVQIRGWGRFLRLAAGLARRLSAAQPNAARLD
jgi:hypothetical protein